MSAHMVSTEATPALCPRCHRLTLTAVSEGLSVRVDTTAMDADTEITTLLTGRVTYTFTAARELVQRTPQRITGSTLRGPVLPDHSCNQPEPVTPPF